MYAPEHSLFGSGNFIKGVEKTGINRNINRKKFNFNELEKELRDPLSLKAQILTGYKKLLSALKKSKAFSPSAGQKVLSFSKQVFSFIRISQDKKETVLCIHNISSKEILLKPEKLPEIFHINFINLISNKQVNTFLKIGPFETFWLRCC